MSLGATTELRAFMAEAGKAGGLGLAHWLIGAVGRPGGQSSSWHWPAGAPIEGCGCLLPGRVGDGVGMRGTRFDLLGEAQESQADILCGLDRQEERSRKWSTFFEEATQAERLSDAFEIIGCGARLDLPFFPVPGKDGELGPGIAVEGAAHGPWVHCQLSTASPLPGDMGVAADEHRLAELGKRLLKRLGFKVGKENSHTGLAASREPAGWRSEGRH